VKVVTKSFLRYLPRRRSLVAVQLLGIACGVAAVIGMSLSARTALSGFSMAIRFLNGSATHQMERIAGPIDERLVAQLVGDPDVIAFSPVIDRKLRLANGRQVRVLGIDPFLDRKIRPHLGTAAQDNGDNAQKMLSFLTDRRAIMVDDTLSRDTKVAVGGDLQTDRGVFRVLGVFVNPAKEPLVLMDIAHAQTLFQLNGYLDRIDLILTGGSSFASRVGQGFHVESSEQRSGSLRTMLSAFRLNLEALSLLALFVGVFLIYNTAMFVVVSRRKDAGILRSLGAYRHEIVASFLSEVLLLGLVGGTLGSFLGFALSRVLIGLVGDTVSNLYFFLSPPPPTWSFGVLVAGILLGCGASLIGSLFPLIELVSMQPIEALAGRVVRRARGRKVKRTAWLGIGFLALSALFLATSSFQVYLGFAGAFAFVTGVSMLTPLAVYTFRTALKRSIGLFGLPGKVAGGNIGSNLDRTAVAVAAFMIALSLTIGLGSMISSFRQSLLWWMDTQLRGDLYVASQSDVDVPEDFYEEIKRMPGVGGTDPYRNVRITFRGEPIFAASIEADVLQKYTRFAWLKGGNENWNPVKKGAVVISESFGRRFHVKTGDSITLAGVHGPESLRIAAIFYDYTTEHGVVMMDRSTYLRIFEDHTISSLGVFIDPAHPRKEELIQAVQRKAAERALPVLSQAGLRKSIMGVFDTTFAVTRSMRMLAIVIAFFGITGALLTLFLERQREFGIYRALGFSSPQVASMTLLEGLGMGLLSFLFSLVVGTILAIILIKVINLNSFNWTIFYYPSWDPYLLALGTAILASMGAALYPILKIYRVYPHMQIREE
jgi:putative ABC transport system permease protein